jgi:hypothetical protein
VVERAFEVLVRDFPHIYYGSCRMSDVIPPMPFGVRRVKKYVYEY